jgi:hypothetical protein
MMLQLWLHDPHTGVITRWAHIKGRWILREFYVFTQNF